MSEHTSTHSHTATVLCEDEEHGGLQMEILEKKKKRVLTIIIKNTFGRNVHANSRAMYFASLKPGMWSLRTVGNLVDALQYLLCFMYTAKALAQRWPNKESDSL